MNLSPVANKKIYEFAVADDGSEYILLPPEEETNAETLDDTLEKNEQPPSTSFSSPVDHRQSSSYASLPYSIDALLPGIPTSNISIQEIGLSHTPSIKDEKFSSAEPTIISSSTSAEPTIISSSTSAEPTIISSSSISLQGIREARVAANNILSRPPEILPPPAPPVEEPSNDVSRAIGRGMYGSVYKYSDGVAIKHFQTNVDDGIAISMREFEVLSLINHPFIMKVEGLHKGSFDIPISSVEIINGQAQVDGNLHMLMEMANRSLYDHIDDGEFTKGTVNKVRYGIAGILLALEYLHKNKIIHRDISTVNTLYFKDQTYEGVTGIYKLCDFGMWGRDEHLYRGDYQNVDYRSPEMLTGGTYDCRTDIWSVGVIMAEMILGENPFYQEPEIITNPATEEEVSRFNSYKAICKMIKNCPIIPGKGMSDWLDKMEGIDCSGYFPTKEESRIGKSKAMKVYNARLKSDTQFWEKIPPECQEILSSMLTWHYSLRPGATKLLNHKFFNPIRSMIDKTRQKYLKVEIEFSQNLCIPSSLERDIMETMYNKAEPSLRYQYDHNGTKLSILRSRDIIHAIHLYFDCLKLELHRKLSNIEDLRLSLFYACVVLAYKYRCTNEFPVGVKDLVPHSYVKRVIELEITVLETLNFALGRYTLYNGYLDLQKVPIDATWDSFRPIIESYFDLPENNYRVKELIKKLVLK